MGQYVESALFETHTLKFAGKTVFVILDIDISTVAEQIFTKVHLKCPSSFFSFQFELQR